MDWSDGNFIFFAHSYCLGERGSNENNNKFIRRFLPKERDFKKVTEKEIKQLEKYINEYRRKLFGEKNQEKYLKWSIQNMKINDTLWVAIYNSLYTIKK